MAQEGGKRLDEPSGLVRYAWLLALAFGVAIAVLATFRVDAVYSSSTLFTALNIVFLSVISFVVSAVAARSYLRDGSRAVLLLGCGTLALGFGGLLAPLHIGGLGANPIATIYNTAALTAGACHLFSSMGSLMERSERRPWDWRQLLSGYMTIVVLVCAVVVLVRVGLWPTYFVEGSGATVWGRAALYGAIALFSLSAVLLGLHLGRPKSSFRGWYSLGLALIAIGLTGISLQLKMGDPLNWVGRSAQYLGCVCMLIAVVATARSGRSWLLTVERALRASEERYRTILDNMPIGFFQARADGGLVSANPAYAKFLGYDSPAELAAAIDEDQGAPRGASVDQAMGAEGEWRDLEHRYRRKDGSHADALLYMSYRPDPDTGDYLTYGFAQDITERKRAEAELRESEDKYRAVVERAHDGIVIAQDGRFVFTNAAFSRMSGYPAEELLDTSFLVVVPPEDHPALIDRFAQRLAGEDIPSTYEIDLVRKDGSRFAADVSADVISYKDAPANLVILRDITERRLAEQALRESEEKFKYVFDHSVIGKSITLPSGELQVNDAFCRMLGYTRAELEHRTWQEVSHPDDIADTQRQVERLQAGAADSARFVKRYLRKDGAVVWADVATALRRDESGRPLYYMTMIVDITERMHAEEEVREREERLRFLIDQTPTINWTLDRDLRFTLSRGGGLPALGLAPDQVLGMHVRDYLGGAGPQTDLGVAMHERALRGESFAYEQPVGDLVFDIMLGPLCDADGAIVGVIGVAYDATARIQADEARRDAESKVAELNVELEQRVLDRTAQLNASNKELAAFAYSVSHDLRAPLRHISGFAGILAEDAGDCLDEEGRQCLDTISNSVHEMGLLIDDLLQFSRTGRAELQIKDVDMQMALSEALLPLQDETKARAIEWSSGPLPHVVGDHALLRQVWANLLDNAVKYSRDRAPARIDVGALDGDSHEVAYFVRDNGVGFDMQYAHKLFGVFQRLHSSAEFEGTGIGLANVQRIISRLGGRVWAEAELDKGATFYFALPRRKESS